MAQGFEIAHVDQFSHIVEFLNFTFDDDFVTDFGSLCIVINENTIPRSFTVLDEITNDSGGGGRHIVSSNNARGGNRQADQWRAEEFTLDFRDGMCDGLCRRGGLKSKSQRSSEAPSVNVFHVEDIVNVPLKGKEK